MIHHVIRRGPLGGDKHYVKLALPSPRKAGRGTARKSCLPLPRGAETLSLQEEIWPGLQ